MTLNGENSIEKNRDDVNETIDLNDPKQIAEKKEFDANVKNAINSAGDFESLVDNLKNNKCGSVADNLIRIREDMLNTIKEEKKEKNLDDIKYNMENILLPEGDLYRGYKSGINLFNEENNKELRSKLIDFLREEMENILK